MWYRSGAALVLSLFAGSISFPLETYISPKYMTWEEFYAGSKLLKEEGWLLGAGFKERRKLFSFCGEIYGGTLRYDGQTQDGDPVETKTDYLGAFAYLGPEVHLSGPLRAGILYRIELWRRRIRSTSEATGYAENWFYHSLDPKVSLQISNVQLYFLYRFVLNARMQASLSGVPELEPKRGTAYELGIDYRRGRIAFGVFFSYLKFRQSSPKRVDTYYVFQPTSVRKLYGLKLGIEF